MSLNHLGNAPVYHDPATGRIMIDRRALRRAPVAGYHRDDVGYDDDDIGDDDDDDIGYDDEMGDDDDEMGAREDRQSRRQGRRNKRRGRRAGRKAKKVMVPSFPAGTATNAAASAADVTATIRVQHQFKCEDVVLDGSTAGTRIKKIKFGDDTILDESSGINEAVFAGANSRFKNMLKGKEISGGLDITVVANIPAAGTLDITFVGEKPGKVC